MATLKVLIVDDEPGIRSGIIRILRHFSVGYPFMDEDFQFELLEAETGEMAIGISEKQPVDIFLLDNKLPGIQGVEVLEHLNRKKYDADVMMITSYASIDLAVKATNNGAYNFVPKPFTPQELKAAMENITKHLVLRRLTRKLDEGGQPLRVQFMSVLSHELKSPLNAIEGYLQIMKDRQAGQDIADYGIMIDRSLERLKGMRGLIHDLLDLTRLETMKERTKEPVDVTEVLRFARDTQEPLARQQQVNIHLIQDESVYMMADRSEMEIICNNLMSNAVKYNRQGGEVVASASKKNGFLQLKVEDTGIGMSDEEVSRLFQEFVRIRNQKTRSVAGSGLGLSIVRKLVESYGGEIKVVSKPDEGSTFTVTLPS